MKRTLSLLLVLLMAVTCCPLVAFAANDDFSLKVSELENKYGINLNYPTDGNGDPSISLNTLVTLDSALNNVTANVVRQVSNYYLNKNGKRLTFSFVQNNSRLTSSVEAVLAGFDNNTSLIELYIPSSSGQVLATGENPISIVHEFGHALHLMYTDQYGYSKMEQEWAAFNRGQSYNPRNIGQNPDETVFISGYAATAFPEDVAETIGHAFIRYQAGQGFSDKLSSGGAATGLGQKLDYVEKIITSYLSDTGDAITNLRKTRSATTSVSYQGMKFGGDYLQFMGYAQPKYVLNGTLRSLGKEMDDAIWIRELGGWYVKEPGGNEIVIFPGGWWRDVRDGFVPPVAA